MDLEWITPADRQLQQTLREPPPVRMELLPVWKQVIMESRQAQTASLLLAAQLRRQRAVLEQQVALSRQQRFALFDRLSYLLS